jgi:hypothetical protein
MRPPEAEGDVLQQLGGLWRRFQEQPAGRQLVILAVPVVVVALLVLGALIIWVASASMLRPPPTTVVQSATPPPAQGGAPPPPKPANPGNSSSPAAATQPAASPAVVDRPTVVVPSPAPSPTPSPSPSPELPPAVSAKVVNTDGQGANMRRTASVSAPRVKLLPEGTIVELLGPEVRGDGYGWRNVRDADGAAGFVIVDYLDPIQGPPGATPVLPPPQITIDEITAPVARGDDATLSITTRPGVRCELRVQLYGPETLPKEATEVKTSDADGHCSWTWKVPDDVVPGTWRYRIIVGEGESSSSRETPIVIT